jgi:hypothetical protein
VNLRVQAEDDLYDTLEDPDGWGLPVVLIDPDGAIIDKSANNPTEDLTGQILYDTTVVNPETGLDMIVHKPVVTLRRSSLSRIPVAGEKWMVKIPEIPDPTATKVLHKVERAPEDGKAIGFIRLYLTRATEIV